MPGYQLRNVCFTTNNPTDEQYDEIMQWCIDHCSYAVIGRETGESGTPHLQGYLELTVRKTFNVVREALFNSHIESRKGPARRASDYCKKEDPVPWEFGELSKQGARNDIYDAYDAIRRNKRKREVAEDFTLTDAKYHRALDRYRSLVEEDDAPAFRDIEVLLYIGPPGTNKSRTAIKENPDAYRLTAPDSNDMVRFDGYSRNDVLILEDFDGWINYKALLTLLDVHKHRLRIMGGWTYAYFTKVIITTNEEVGTWYPKRKDIKALKRRITKVTRFHEM